MSHQQRLSWTELSSLLLSFISCSFPNLSHIYNFKESGKSWFICLSVSYAICQCLNDYRLFWKPSTRRGKDLFFKSGVTYSAGETTDLYLDRPGHNLALFLQASLLQEKIDSVVPSGLQMSSSCYWQKHIQAPTKSTHTSTDVVRFKSFTENMVRMQPSTVGSGLDNVSHSDLCPFLPFSLTTFLFCFFFSVSFRIVCLRHCVSV